MGKGERTDFQWFVLIKAAVLGETPESSELDAPIDLERSVCKALDLLSERENDILMKRILDRKTLAECGDEFCISRERVRAIEARALRKLRAIPTVYLFVQGEEKYLRSKQEREEFRRFNIKQKADKYGEYSINMLDLSVRSYNALTRNGISTINGLLELVSEGSDEMLKIPGIGFKSANEILDKLTGSVGEL